MYIFVLYFTCRTVNDRTYHGVAKEKAIANAVFEDRLQAGENVGLVESRYVHASKDVTSIDLSLSLHPFCIQGYKSLQYSH